MSTVDQPTGAATPPPRRVSTSEDADTSLAALVHQLAEESSRLVRSELRLAQAEMSQKAKQAGLGLGALGVAGVLAWFGLGCLLATVILLLALVLPAWLAALIVTVVVLVAAAIAALIGKRKVSEAAPAVPTTTVESVKTDVQEIKESARR